MKVKIIGKYGYLVQASEMLDLLGVSKLPVEAMPERVIQGVRVYVLAQRPLKDRERKRSSHRVMCVCECGRHIPVGRLHQHICK